MRALLPFVAIAALATRTHATCDSTGCGPYTPLADVSQEANIALDVGEIKTLLSSDPPDYAAATTIYQEGSNAYGLTLQGIGSGDMEDQGSQDLGTQVFTSPTWLDDLTSEALAGTGVFDGASDVVRTTAINKNLLCTTLFAATYEGHHASLDAAASIVADNNENTHFDKSWAFYYGDGTNSPYAVAGKRDDDFLTSNQADIDTLFNDRVSVASLFLLRLHFAITYMQAALKYAYKAQEDITDLGAWAEGYVYFRCGAPIMAEGGEEVIAALIEVDAAFQLTAGALCAPAAYCAVKDAVDKFQAVVEAAFLPPLDLGTYASDHGDATTGIPDDYCSTTPSIADLPDDYCVPQPPPADDHDDHDAEETLYADTDSPGANLAVSAAIAAAGAAAFA